MVNMNGVCTKESEIKEGIVQAFHNVLSELVKWRPNISDMNFGTLDVSKLEEPFLEKEVYSALLDLNRNKALRPYGFLMAFWKFRWDFVKEEVMRFFKDFH